jgi:hypothetical protein
MRDDNHLSVQELTGGTATIIAYCRRPCSVLSFEVVAALRATISSVDWRIVIQNGRLPFGRLTGRQQQLSRNTGAERRIAPTGKSLPIVGNRVKPQNKKYFAFSE